MLVDKMEYQGQQGGGGAQDDAFYELLSSTAMANAKKHQPQPQFEQQQAFDSRSEEPGLPSYDFLPNSSAYGGVPSHIGEENASGMAPVVSSYPSGSQFQASRQHPPIPSFVDSTPARQERGSSTTSEAATVAAVEQTMKKYMDNLMHTMESLTGRIGQLESSTRRLEQMVTEFKGGSDKNQGAAGGKLLLIETMLSEVQRGVHELRNKQEAMEAQSNMGKLHLGEESSSLAPIRSQISLEPQSPRAPQLQLPEPPSSYPPHHPPHPPPPYMVPPQLVGLPPPPPPAVHPESHYPPSQQGGPPPQQFYGQQQQQQQQQGPPPPPPPPPAPPAHSHGPPPFSHQPELPPYGATLQGPYKGQSVSFGQEVPLPYGNRLQQGPPSGSGGPSIYDQAGLLPPYQSQGRPAAPGYEQRQEQPPPGYSNAGYRTGQQAPSAPSSGAGGYPRLPTAQPVQHAIPTGREREGAAAPSGSAPLSTNRLSIDDVIDKVAVMGFSKDQVRAVVRRLTENGQSVDLNIVLDKLMNGEAGQQQTKAWFQRG